MNEAEITRAIGAMFTNIDIQVGSREDGSPEIAWGDICFFHAPDRQTPAERKFPFATIVAKDYGAFDCASNLNRPGVFRLNVGVSKQTEGPGERPVHGLWNRRGSELRTE